MLLLGPRGHNIKSMELMEMLISSLWVSWILVIPDVSLAEWIVNVYLDIHIVVTPRSPQMPFPFLSIWPNKIYRTPEDY